VAQTSNPRRERYRRETREEAKEIALAQLAEAGIHGISLNAIAKALGMSGPALYRYFDGRDALLTELISDAYRDLSGAVRAGFEAAGTDTGNGETFRAVAHALHGWARRHPDRYLLIYGTPVPGYHAPPETTQIAASLMRTVLEACAALGPSSTGSRDALTAHLEGSRPWGGEPDADASVKGLALRAWARLHGVISLEVQGQFAGMGFDPDVLFESEVQAIVRDS